MVNWIDRVKKEAVELIVVAEKLDKNVDEETINFRKSVCSSCENNKNGVCAICGCYIDIKVTSKKNRTIKGTTEVTHCPKGKWGDKDLAIFYSLIN